ncbi:hypothetical protein EVA_12743 [gut metagenome]|uniref:Uncharacterized protein n=1 Tax=gut metagenome TaxID=749906 RepID=J9FVY9_9ZZZZ
MLFQRRHNASLLLNNFTQLIKRGQQSLSSEVFLLYYMYI